MNTKRFARTMLLVVAVACGGRTSLDFENAGNTSSATGAMPAGSTSSATGAMPAGSSSTTCGRDCCGGACQAGACQPVVIAQSGPDPGEPAVDDSFIYWPSDQTSSNASIMKAPK